MAATKSTTAMLDEFLAVLADEPGHTSADIGRLIETHLLPAHERVVRENVAREIETDTGRSPWHLQQGGVNHAWIDSRDCTKAARIARGGS
jgi:hypothetical protein